MVTILGIGGLVHDSNMTLLVNGVPKIILEEERISRKKHIGGEWDKSWETLTKKYNISKEDIDYVAVSREKIPEAHSKKQEGLNRILEKFSKEKIIYVKHHLTHASNAFYPSEFKKAAILTIDGLGDNESSLAGVGEKNKITQFYTISQNDSIGLQWIRLTHFLGYNDLFSSGKIMGLASYGKPKYYNLFKEIIEFDKNGKYKIKTGKYDPRMILRCWEKELPYFMSQLCNPKNSNEEFNQVHMDIAASLQKITEDVILHMTKYLYKKTKLKNICLSGGVALNGFVNQRIIEETGFKNIFIQPACSDCGDGFGAALYVYHEILGNKNRWKMKNAYLGEEFTENEIKKAIPPNLKFDKYDDIEKITAKLISEGKIIGWYQGRSEFGPRALGNRSILADARDPEMKNKINSKVKHREWFRPFAPSVLNKFSKEYFGIKDSPYMLRITQVKNNKIPSVTHIDKSARVQTVSRKENPKFYKLISEFYKLTKVPVILNTSFNDKGEPIVNSPNDAIKTFLNTEIDYLVMGNYLISK